MRTSKQPEALEIDGIFQDLLELGNESSEIQPSDAMIAQPKASIEQLKPGYRDIIIAVDFEGYTYKEISQETGIPEGTLMSRRHRAIGILYKKLESQNNTH
jgi:RNA polymerase sigma-70 factor (ECF subfamily)